MFEAETDLLQLKLAMSGCAEVYEEEEEEEEEVRKPGRSTICPVGKLPPQLAGFKVAAWQQKTRLFNLQACVFILFPMIRRAFK